MAKRGSDQKPEAIRRAPTGVGRDGWLAGVWWMLPVLWLITFVIYQPAWQGGVLWDDPAHLTRPELQSVAGLQRIWTDVRATQQYYPIVNSAFWVMNKLWGHQTFGYHLINILLHASSAFLFGLLLRRLSVPGAWLAACLFAVHPIEVESVAWMTELKNTLSGFFYLFAAHAYLRFDEKRQTRFYVIAIGVFVLALMSKTVTATLPGALLVVFWWQRGRIDWRRDVVPLVPFFILGLSGGLATAWIERTLLGAQGAEFQISAIQRGLIAGRVIWFYLGKQLWPSTLIFMYSRWRVSPQEWWQYLFPAAAIALVAGAWWWRTRSRAPLAFILLYIGALFPALGFFNVYPFRYSYVADHFQYLAGLPTFAAVAAVITLLTSRWITSPSSRAALIFVLCAPLAALSWFQARHYVDATTLWNVTLARNPDCWMCHSNLAAEQVDKGPEHFEDAIAHLQTALRLYPASAPAHNTLGLVYQRMGRLDEALTEAREAVRLDPDLAEAHYNLALDHQLQGELDAAIESYNECLRLDPTNAKARFNLANALRSLSRFDEAVAQLSLAVELDPNSPEIRQNLGSLLLRLGHTPEAATQFREAVRLKPDSAENHNNLGLSLRRSGQLAAAVEEFREAARLMPTSVAILRNFGEGLLAAGRLNDAVVVFNGALALEPDANRPDLYNMLGVAEGRLGRRDAAIRAFQEALRLRPDFPSARTNLAAALAAK